jgi:hypothetical protein
VALPFATVFSPCLLISGEAHVQGRSIVYPDIGVPRDSKTKKVAKE